MISPCAAVKQLKAALAVVAQECQRLKFENARLRQEIAALKAERPTEEA
jgi:regulator of replication initiation timing